MVYADRQGMIRPTAVLLSACLVVSAPGSSALAAGLSVPVLRVPVEVRLAGAPGIRPLPSAPAVSGPGLSAPAALTAVLLAPSPCSAPAPSAAAVPVAAVPAAVSLTAAAGEKGESGEAARAASEAFDGASAERDPVSDLEAGERTFAPEPRRDSLDEHTLADLEVMAPTHGLHALLARKARTAYGARRLETLLSRPFLDAGEIRRRQAAARELAEDSSLRARVGAAFDALGSRADATARAGFFRSKIDKPTFVLGAALSAAALYFIGTTASQAVTAGTWRPLLTLAQGLIPWMMFAGNLIPRLQAAREDILRYKAVVKLADTLAEPLSRSRSEALRELGAEFAAVQDKSQLGGLTGRLSRVIPSGAAMFPDFLYLHSALTLWSVASSVQRRRAEFARLFGALSELDAYQALAETSRAHEGWSAYPEILEDAQPRLRIDEGHHPYLAARGGSVGNDARLEPGANFHLLTGVNMGGKSTYLKMTALLALLAQIGAPVPARAMALTPLELLTSIEIKHDLAEGKSLYDAETDRILEVIRRAESGTRLFVLIDEILQGTNPQDRAAIERAIVRYLSRTERLFLVATHNLDVVTLEGEEQGVRNVHVEESSDGRATHKVMPGPSTTRNAVETLERKGFPAEIVRDSRR